MGHQLASEKMEPAGENHLIVVNNDVSLCGSATIENGPSGCFQAAFLVCRQLIYLKEI